MKYLGEFLSRAPFVLLGALGLFSIVGTFMTLDENIAQTLEAWRSVTRPIWNFLFGWVEFFGIAMPWWMKDYLTVGLITFFMFVRALVFVPPTLRPTNSSGQARMSLKWEIYKTAWRILRPNLLRYLRLLILTWPVVWLSQLPLSESTIERDAEYGTKGDYRREQVFFETFVYALIFIAINYALIVGLDLPSRPPEIEIWV